MGSSKEHIANHSIDPETGFLENPAYAHDFDAKKKKTFLSVFKLNGLGFFRTCRQLGMSCSTVHKHYQIDSVFKKALDEAREEYGDELESTSRLNALNPRSVIERIFQLKSLFPEKYGDVKSSGSTVINLVFDGKTLDISRKRDEILNVEEIPSSQITDGKTLENKAD